MNIFKKIFFRKEIKDLKEIEETLMLTLMSGMALKGIGLIFEPAIREFSEGESNPFIDIFKEMSEESDKEWLSSAEFILEEMKKYEIPCVRLENAIKKMRWINDNRKNVGLHNTITE